MVIMATRVVAQTVLAGAFAPSMSVGIQVADRGLAFTAKAADARQGRGADNPPGDVRRGRGTDDAKGRR